MTEQLYNAGEVVIEKLSILSGRKRYDIKDFVLETVIFEDIFSNTMSGYVVIKDSASFITQLPLIGGTELIEVKFRTPQYSTTIEKTFFITGISERIMSEKTQAYVLNMMSKEALTDNITRVSKKFSGTTHDIIGKIYKDYLFSNKNLITTEAHASSVSVVSPYWSPLKLINWICNRSYKTVPNVLFFESNKSFYLASVESLIRRGVQNVFGAYSYIPNASQPGSTDVNTKYKMIQSISPVTMSDVLRDQDFGYYSSKLITHDITTKQYLEFTSDQYQYHKKVFNLHDKGNTQTYSESVPRNPDGFRSVRTKQFNMFEENKDPNYEAWAMQRNSLIQEAQHLKLNIEVAGRTDIEVGVVLNLTIPKATNKDITSQNINNYIDPYLSGLYLVTAIRHSFLVNKHTMYMEVMKDSFSKQIN